MSALTEYSPWVPRVVNAAAGCATALATWTAARQLGFSRGWRLAAGGVAALYAPALFLEGEILAEPLAGALAAWALVAMLWARGRSGPGRVAVPAMMAGLAALVRAPLAVLPLMVGALRLRTPERRGASLLVILGVTFLVWAGPMLLMHRAGEGLRFPSTQGGINFAIGNHAGADGRAVNYPPGFPEVGWREFESVLRSVPERQMGHAVTASEASAYWAGRGLAFWKDHPLDAVRLTVTRLVLLVHGNETPNNRSMYAARGDSPVVRILLVPGPPYLPGGLLWPLSWFGVWWVWRRRTASAYPVAGWFVASLLPLAVFFVCSRFRVPALAPAVLLALLTLQAIPRMGPGTRGVLVAVLIAANLPLGALTREDPAREALVRAESALNAGRLALAEAAYRRAAALDPQEARAGLGLAGVALAEGAPARAIQALQSVPELEGTWSWEYLKARALDGLGRPEEALPHALRAVSAFPENPELQGYLGLLAESLERTDLAVEALSRACLLGSRDPEVWNSYALAQRSAGNLPDAGRAWNRAVDLDPSHFKARYNRSPYHAEGGRVSAAESDLQAALALAPSEADRERVRRTLDLLRNRLP